MNTSGPLLEASISAYPFVAVHPKHRLDLSPPRLAFAAREKSLRHRLLREPKLFTLPLAVTPRFLPGLESWFLSASGTNSSQQSKGLCGARGHPVGPRTQA